MLVQNFGVTKKEHYGMLWYFLEWSISLIFTLRMCKQQHDESVYSHIYLFILD